MRYCFFKSPVGDLLLNGNELLEGLHFSLGKTRVEPGAGWIQDKTFFSDAMAQLDAYFTGDLKQFDLELKVQGTHFQKTVWKELLTIPYGETLSYGELAQRIKNPKACRAVGLANGKNPIPIIIPCHRVIGKKGSLTGFGGGIETKKMLLDLEKQHNG